MLSTQAGIALGALNSLRAPGPVRYVDDEMRILLVAIGAAMVISGCGSVATSSSPSPIPSTSPNLNFDVAVSEKDRKATMRVGQKLEVVLHANTGMTNWAQPKSSDESILVPIVDPAATAARGVTLAAFQAKSTGQADITAYAGPVCSPGLACPMYVVVFSVRVTVTA
jgi:uncharacterized protein YceK